METFPRRHLIAGSIAVAAYVVGVTAIDRAMALDAASSNGSDGNGSSLSEQTDHLSGQSDHERGERARDYVENYPHETWSSSDSQDGDGSYGGGDHTGGGAGPK